MSEYSNKFIGKSQYFTAYKEDGEIKLVDLNENYTMLSKEELQELIQLLQKCKNEL